MIELGISELLDTEKMSEEDVKRWKDLEEKFSKSAESYLKDELGIDGLKKTITDIENSVKSIKDDAVDKKSFEGRFKEVEETLLRIKAATERGSKGEIRIKSLEEQIAYQLKEYITEDSRTKQKVLDLKKACKDSPGSKRTIELVVKANTPTTTSGLNLTAGVTIDPQLDVPPRAETYIRNVATVAPTSTRSLTYAEMKSTTGDAEWVPEGGLKPSMSAKFGEVTVNAGKVALTATVTEECLIDTPQVAAEIQTEIINKIGLKEEEGILEGDGTDGSINGPLKDLPAFSLTGLSVEKPNMFDAVVAAYTQIVSVSKMNYRPNAVVMNTVDYAKMQLTKDANGQYLRPFNIGDELIQGLRVIQTTSIEQGNFIMGDFSYLNIRDYMTLRITFGWVNDDFQRNQVTILGEKRLLAYIKSNHKIAFVSDKFSSVITAITPVA